MERKELQLSKVQCKIEMSPTNNSNGPMSPTHCVLPPSLVCCNASVV